ncbi:2'-5' RNA ligase family protein [Dactylosporangium sp. NPDC051485]|uniref:2'-5' RNA ligase family protein n=1 Tax=Dactylosporangium sp. NPDC051485 TaxID=3154846 RepID=UPI0034439674
MERFISDARVWREPSRFHVYVLPDLHRDQALAGLIGKARTVMAGYPAIAAVPDAWLHATVQMVTGRAGDDITTGQREALTAAVQHRLGGVAPFTVTAGSALANRSGVVLDLDGDEPDEPWTALSSGVRDAITDVFGPGSTDYDPGPPHITLGYAHGPADSGEVQSALRRTVRPSHAPLHVDAVWVLDVIQDPARSEYRWRQPVARIPLHGSAR